MEKPNLGTAASAEAFARLSSGKTWTVSLNPVVQPLSENK